MQKGLFEDDHVDDDDSDEEGGNRKGVRWGADVVQHDRKMGAQGMSRMGSNVSSGPRQSNAGGLISVNMH